MKAAILGLGLIGSVWAKHLEKDGVLAATWNRTPKPDAPRFQNDVATAIANADIVHLCLFDGESVLAVLEKIESKLTPNHTVIQSTTIDPDSSDLCKSHVKRAGATYVEAPFTGSLPAAEQRKTLFMLGAPQEVISKLAEYLSHLSERHFTFATARQAAAFKLIMNLQIASAVHTASEGLVLSRREGIDDGLFFEAFKQNAAFSPVVALKQPLFQRGDFTGTQFSVKNMEKDLRLLSKMAGNISFGVETVILEALGAALSAGRREEDFSSVLKTIGT